MPNEIDTKQLTYSDEYIAGFRAGYIARPENRREIMRRSEVGITEDKIKANIERINGKTVLEIANIISYRGRKWGDSIPRYESIELFAALKNQGFTRQQRMIAGVRYSIWELDNTGRPVYSVDPPIPAATPPQPPIVE